MILATTKNQEKILGLLRRLADVWELHREEIFQELALFTQDHEVDFIFENFLATSGWQAIPWLIRYLNTAGTPYALQKILILCGHDNDNIRREVCAGIEKIPGERQLVLLLRMLELSPKDIKLFAIKQLGFLGRSAATVSLLRLLKQSRDEDILIAILQVFGQLKDTRALPTLERYTAQAKVAIQEIALQSIEKYATRLNSRFLHKCLRSKEARFRQMAYLIILRSQIRGWERLLAVAFRQETDERVKMRVLVSVRNLEHPGSLEVLLEMALKDPSGSVRMMVRSVLRRVRSPQICSWLWHEYPRADTLKQELILRIFSFYAQDSAVAHQLLKLFVPSPDRHRRVIIAALGNSADPEVREFLLKLVLDETPYAYAAATALAERIRLAEWRLVQTILELDEKNFSSVLQVFLNYLFLLPLSIEIPRQVVLRVEQLTESEQTMIRLLAVRVFSRDAGVAQLSRLLDLLLAEEGATSRQVILKEVVRIVNQDPQALEEALRICLPRRELFPVIVTVFTQIAVASTAQLAVVVRNILDLRLQRGSSARSLDEARMEVLIRNVTLRAKSSFLEIFERQEWTDDERRILLQVIQATDLYRFGSLDIDFMAQQYQQASVMTKMEFLNFFQRLRQIPLPLERVVFDDLSKNPDPKLGAKIKEVVVSWAEQ